LLRPAQFNELANLPVAKTCGLYVVHQQTFLRGWTMDVLTEPPAERLAYTIEEAVKITRVGRSVLYKFIQNGELPIVKIGKRTLIRRAAIEEFLRGRERRVV
jgi:excisionase family DNA binding protein